MLSRALTDTEVPNTVTWIGATADANASLNVGGAVVALTGGATCTLVDEIGVSAGGSVFGSTADGGAVDVTLTGAIVISSSALSFGKSGATPWVHAMLDTARATRIAVSRRSALPPRTATVQHRTALPEAVAGYSPQWERSISRARSPVALSALSRASRNWTRATS